MSGAIGFLGGLIFGLMVAWGVVGMLIAGIGVAVMVLFAFLPTMLRGLFGLAIIGFLAAFMAAGGLTLL